jgi:hypothetical protein
MLLTEPAVTIYLLTSFLISQGSSGKAMTRVMMHMAGGGMLLKSLLSDICQAKFDSVVVALQLLQLLL